jgi:hypothetical protein
LFYKKYFADITEWNVLRDQLQAAVDELKKYKDLEQLRNSPEA